MESALSPEALRETALSHLLRPLSAFNSVREALLKNAYTHGLDELSPFLPFIATPSDLSVSQHKTMALISLQSLESAPRSLWLRFLGVSLECFAGLGDWTSYAQILLFLQEYSQKTLHLRPKEESLEVDCTLALCVTRLRDIQGASIPLPLSVPHIHFGHIRHMILTKREERNPRETVNLACLMLRMRLPATTLSLLLELQDYLSRASANDSTRSSSLLVDMEKSVHLLRARVSRLLNSEM